MVFEDYRKDTPLELIEVPKTGRKLPDTLATEEIDALMKKGDNISIEKILDKFIVADKHLILKTDIEDSRAFTVLKLMVFDLKQKGLKIS